MSTAMNRRPWPRLDVSLVQVRARAHANAHLRVLALAVALAIALAVTGAGVRASEAARDELDAPYAFQAAQSTPLDALDRFARDHGLRLRIARADGGNANSTLRTARLAGWLRADSGRDFLERLSSAHHFDWFVANRTLHVSARSASRAERIALGGLDPETARSALAAVGLYEPRFGWGVLTGQDAVLVGGPREYRSLLRGFLAAHPVPAAGSGAAKPGPMVFTLRHARAADSTTFEGGKTRSPGVASILRQLLTGEDAHRATHPFWPQDQTSGLPGISSSGPPPLPLADAIFGHWPGGAHTVPPLPDWRSTGAALPAMRKTDVIVMADERTNTVFAWGDPTLRARAAHIIEALDRPLPMISMEILVLETDDVALEAPASASRLDPGGGALPTSTAAAPSIDARWLNALAERRARVLNRQRIVGFANRHLTLAIGAEEPNAPAPSSEASADHANGRSGRRGDALDLVARIVPAPPSGQETIAVDIGLAMRQPTGLPGQEWASTSSTELTTAVVLEPGAAPRLVAAYPVATSRARQRAVLLSAHAL